MEYEVQKVTQDPKPSGSVPSPLPSLLFPTLFFSALPSVCPSVSVSLCLSSRLSHEHTAFRVRTILQSTPALCETHSLFMVYLMDSQGMNSCSLKSWFLVSIFKFLRVNSLTEPANPYVYSWLY